MELFPEKENPNDSVGYYIYYYPNGNKRSEGPQIGKKENGEWKYYQENGTCYYKTMYFNGRNQGWIKYYNLAVTFFDSSQIDSSIIALDKAKEIIKIEFTTKDNDIYSKGIQDISAYYLKMKQYKVAEYLNLELIEISKEIIWK